MLPVGVASANPNVTADAILFALHNAQLIEKPKYPSIIAPRVQDVLNASSAL